MTLIAEVRGAIAVDRAELDRIRGLYEAGDYPGAYEVARAIGPFERWVGAAAKVMGGRLAAHVGAPRLGSSLHVRAWREDPTDPEACYYAGRTILGRRGPLEGWAFLRRVGALEGAPGVIRSDWLASHAIALGTLRDFDAAESYLADAEALAPGRAWLRVERSSLFEMQDRYPEALASAREALELWPWYRPAVQAVAHLLQLLDREAEAADLLAEASEHTACGVIAAHLATIQIEMGRDAEALRTLDRFEALSPLMDKSTRRWLAGRRSDAAYHLGDLAAAAKHARESGEPFFLALADRIESPEAGADTRRGRLAVGFVRQHHQTCAPATLAAIARFWGKDTDHLAVADAICYDGTPDHRERSWAESNGWAAREFTVTWDATVALIDRGVPFTITTVETQSAHLQAVIGYDARRGTLLIRDPTLPHEGEALSKPFLERYRSVGPRGMALVPVDRAELLDGLDLPEAHLHDHLHRMQVALREHDRATAASALEALRAEAPGHRLEHHARRLLAIYDADGPGMLAALEALGEAFPEDVNIRLARLSCLRDQGRRDDRLALYREACAGPRPDPVLRRQYAHELLADARDRATAGRLARRALRARPTDAAGVYALARVAWEDRRLADALELYRFAACLDDKDEGLARSYFVAARHLHREGEPLRLLEGRSRRLGALSSQPARTLHWALGELERAAEAQAVLDEALRLRPEGGDLLLFAAEADASTGERERASARLEAARGHCRRGDWLRTAANLASNRGDLAEALKLWREVLEIEPTALDANRSAARLLAETEGRPAAIAHLTAACERSPHNYSLQQALIEWLRDEGPEAAEPAIRRLLEIHPADAWGHRELALVLSEAGRHDEAAAALEVAAALEPRSTTEASVRGFVLERAGRIAEARAAYREAIARDVDNEPAIGRLVETAESHGERVADLAFVAAELERQVTFGDGLLAFARRARGALGPDELLARLTTALEARPDLWHAWSALVRERIERGEADEAVALAETAVARFPLLPKLWLDLAAARGAKEDRAGEREALGRALQINPGWGTSARELALALEREGNYEESRAVIERAIAHAPLDAINHGFLADTLWHLGEKDAAVERISLALRLDPAYDWGWRSLAIWSDELGRPEATAELARELTRQRPGDARGWLALARSLSGPEAAGERIAALDRAAAIDPRDYEPHDLKARLLADAGRFDEAEAACRPAWFGDRTPVPLRGRAAWVAAQAGDLARVMATMRPVLDDNPDYAWGWRQMAEWASEAGSDEAYLEAAETSARLWPDDVVSMGYLGDARARKGDRAGARESFRRALEREPAYGYGAMKLFDLDLEDGELDDAAATLDLLRAHGEPGDPFVIAREVQYHAARADRAAATETLQTLFEAPENGSDWPFRAADKAFSKAGWGTALEEACIAALSRPEAATMIGVLWADRWTARKDWREARRLGPMLATGGEAARQALVIYVRALGQARASWRLRGCIRRHHAILREHPIAWGMVGFSLTNVVRHRAAARWLADWPGREGLQAWMLINLVLSLRALGRDDEAGHVGRRALELDAEVCTPYHRVWLALDDLLAGRAEEAAARLDGIDPANFDVTNRYLLRLAEILLDVERSAPADRPRAALASRTSLLPLNRSSVIPIEDYGAVLHIYRRAARRLAGSARAWLRPVLGVSLWIQPPMVGRG